MSMRSDAPRIIDILFELRHRNLLIVYITLILGFWVLLVSNYFGSISNLFTAALLGAMILYFILAFIQVINKNPIPLTISLLGFPSAGKTVFLTILFDQLQRIEDAGIQFSPYGQETVENVINNLNTLSRRIWLPATQPNTVLYYRANASIGSGIFRNRYKIEIADFAGEKIEELEPSKEAWLHKSDYFKYVTQSEAVLLAVDCQVLITHDRVKIEEMQNAFVAAIQILIENKGVPENRMLHAPVALLFLKTDLLKGSEIMEEELPNMIPRLISVCEKRCENFQYFFVSSIGDLGHDGSPPETLNPKNVAKPIVWILKKV